MKVAYTDAKRNFYRLNQRYKELLERCEQASETEFVDWVGERRSELKRRLRVKYVNKFKWILKKQLPERRKRSFDLGSVLTTIGEVQIPSFAREVMEKGPSYALLKDTKVVDDIPVIERLIEDQEELEKENLRWTFLKQRDRKLTRMKIMELKQERVNINKTIKWMRENNYTLTREEKTRKMMLLERECYENFLQEYLSETGAVELDKDPMFNLQMKVEGILRNRSFPQIWKVLKQEELACPRLFAYIKVHKTPVAARPIVEKRLAPT